jgi:predicted ATP-grasp superfamily ATP-dependent carboligase
MNELESYVPVKVYKARNGAFMVQVGHGPLSPEAMYCFSDFDALVLHLAVHFGVKEVKQGTARAVRDEGNAHLG